MAYNQVSHKKNNPLLNLLLFVMIISVVAIIYLLVPRLAEESFGSSSPALTASQRWIYGAKLLLNKDGLLENGCKAGKPIDFEISQGESIYSISSDLQAKGLIKDVEGFRNYLIYKGYDTNILANHYSLNCMSSPVDIAGQIKNNFQENVIFNILPGWRSEEIANALASSGIEVDAQEFLAVVKNPVNLQLPEYIPQGSSVEGFLFPGEYTISRKISAQELVLTFLTRFESEMTRNNVSLSPKNGLDFYQTIILASIIQRETYTEAERPLIASVFYNRLASGMKLETDPTVQYALGYNEQWGWWKSPLSSDDLNVASDYNTYQVNGLPPSPIANPDLSSIQAAENPQQSNYYYFRAKCDDSGMHLFAQTLDEQIANACK
jgi:UPF0755 protein